MSNEMLNQSQYEHLSVRQTPVSGIPSLVKTSHADKLKSRNIMSTFAPLNTPTSIFTASQQYADVEISSDSVHVLRQCTLQLNVSNGLTGAIGVVPVPYLIDHVEIYVGSTLVEIIQADHLYTELLLHNSDSTIRLLASSLNMAVPSYSISGGTQQNNVYGSQGTLAGLASRTWMIDLYSFVNQSELFLPALKQRLKYRIYFRGGTPIYTSGSDGLTLNSLNLLCQGVKFDDDVLGRLINRYLSKPHYARAIIRRNFPISYSAMSATQKTFTLTGISGTFSHLVFFLRVASASAAQLYTFYDIDIYSLLQSNGMPDGFPNITKEFVRSNVIPALGFSSGACGIVGNASELTSQAVPIMVHSFSHRPEDVFETANSLGSNFLNGLWQLQPTLTSAKAGGVDGELVVNAYQYALVCQQTDGSVTIMYQ